jgi:hypothetical protein
MANSLKLANSLVQYMAIGQFRQLANSVLQVASASGNNTVRLWDSATGASLQTLEGHSGEIWAVAFSSDGQYLDTNIGQLDIGFHFPSVIPPRSKSVGEREISVNKTWVVQGMEKVFWLPSNYRVIYAAVRNNALAMGHASGRVSIIGLDVAKTS